MNEKREWQIPEGGGFVIGPFLGLLFYLLCYLIYLSVEGSDPSSFLLNFFNWIRGIS
jgi:hypothetical protein